jgi:Flp pilus assembly protein TadG
VIGQRPAAQESPVRTGSKRYRPSDPKATASRRGRKSSRGQSLVEFALIFPVFMLILAGILDFGFMLYTRMTVINATREGAREAITYVNDPQNIPTFADQRIRAVAAGTGVVDASLTDTVTCVHIKSASCDFVAGGQPDPQSGDAVKVTTHYTYRSFFPLLFGTTFDLSSTVQMVIE